MNSKSHESIFGSYAFRLDFYAAMIKVLLDLLTPLKLSFKNEVSANFYSD